MKGTITWHNIENAPKDGTWIIALTQGSSEPPFIIQFKSGLHSKPTRCGWQMRGCDIILDYNYPTHFAFINTPNTPTIPDTNPNDTRSGEEDDYGE